MKVLEIKFNMHMRISHTSCYKHTNCERNSYGMETVEFVNS